MPDPVNQLPPIIFEQSICLIHRHVEGCPGGLRHGTDNARESENRSTPLESDSSNYVSFPDSNARAREIADRIMAHRAPKPGPSRSPAAIKQREYRAKNKERAREKYRRDAHTHRARVSGGGGSFTVGEFIELCARFNNACANCGSTDSLTVDHVIPVTFGGSSDISNIQPLCWACNRLKGDEILDFRGEDKPELGRPVPYLKEPLLVQQITGK